MQNKLTQKELKSQLSYDPHTGVFIRKVKSAICNSAGDIAGGKHTQGYITISINNKPYLAHRLAFLYMEGYLPEHDVHHINNVKNDNRRCNLKHITKSCHRKQEDLRQDNTSGVTGVCWDRSQERWVARLNIHGKTFHLGRYKIFEDAVMARWEAEVDHEAKGCRGYSSSYQYLIKRGIITKEKCSNN